MNKHMYILADGGRIAASGPSEFTRLRGGGGVVGRGAGGGAGRGWPPAVGRYTGWRWGRRGDTPEHFMDDLKKYGYIKG